MNKTDEIKEKFFSFLLKKTCTTKQAEEFLSRSKLPENFIKSLMLEAQNMGLIDDGAFAKLFIEGHLHWGNAKIIYELKSKGISHETIYNIQGLKNFSRLSGNRDLMTEKSRTDF